MEPAAFEVPVKFLLPLVGAPYQRVIVQGKHGDTGIVPREVEDGGGRQE